MQIAIKAKSKWRFVTSLAMLVTVAGCGSQGQNAVRDDAARRFSCPASRVDVEDWGPRSARASGCGKTLVYSCQQSQGSSQAPIQQTPLTEGEAHSPAQAGGSCTWVPND